jgi:hypothetical protein
MNFLQAIGFLPVHPVEEDLSDESELLKKLEGRVRQLETRLEVLETLSILQRFAGKTPEQKHISHMYSVLLGKAFEKVTTPATVVATFDTAFNADDPEDIFNLSEPTVISTLARGRRTYGTAREL